MGILVLADIHGNAEALEAVLLAEPSTKYIIFLGDLAYPGPQVKKTIDLLSNYKGTFIRGNHDFNAINPHLVSSWPEPWRVLYEAIYKNLDDRYLDFYKRLQRGGRYRVFDRDICLQHGELSEGSRHVLPSASDELLLSVANGVDCPLTLFGHSHIQFRRKVSEREFVNPGSVGQNRCGQQIACYGWLTESSFEHRHVGFDPSNLLLDIDRLVELESYPDFRDWLKESVLSGFGVGRKEPWTTLAKQGYC